MEQLLGGGTSSFNNIYNSMINPLRHKNLIINHLKIPPYIDITENVCKNIIIRLLFNFDVNLVGELIAIPEIKFFKRSDGTYSPILFHFSYIVCLFDIKFAENDISLLNSGSPIDFLNKLISSKIIHVTPQKCTI